MRAKKYTDTAWITRDDINECFKNTWQEGHSDMMDNTYGLYKFEELDETLRRAAANGRSLFY